MAPRLEGSNSERLDPAKFLSDYRELRMLENTMQDAVADYRAKRKKMKAAGVDLAALALLEALRKLDDDEATIRIRNVQRYGAWTDTAFLKQGDLFAAASDDPQPDDEAKMAHAEGEAEFDGIGAGRNGHKIEANPFEPGTRNHVAWVKGWHAGQARAVHEQLGGKKPKKGAGETTAAPKTVRRGRTSAAAKDADSSAI
ncbi:MAG: hypothetical protein ACEQSH_00375 [Bacteroidia bacterium]